MMKVKFLMGTRRQCGVVAVGLGSNRASSNIFLSSSKRSHRHWNPDSIEWVPDVFPEVERLRSESVQ
jgi:hypothetical protein